jgi:hypothetical protein
MTSACSLATVALGAIKAVSLPWVCRRDHGISDLAGSYSNDQIGQLSHGAAGDSHRSDILLEISVDCLVRPGTVLTATGGHHTLSRQVSQSGHLRPLRLIAATSSGTLLRAVAADMRFVKPTRSASLTETATPGCGVRARECRSDEQRPAIFCRISRPIPQLGLGQ